MDNVWRAEKIFTERREYVNRRRKRGQLPSEERTVQSVLVHTIAPVKRQKRFRKQTASKTLLPAPQGSAIRRPNADPTSVSARFMDTVSFVQAGGPSVQSVQYSVGARVAHANIKQVEYALLRLRTNLRQENGKSRCLGPLDAIIKSLQINLPNLLPEITITDGRS